MTLPQQLSAPAYWRKAAPRLGLRVSFILAALPDRNGTIVRLRKPFGTVDIEMDSGEIRYFVTNDPYAPVYWAP